MPKGESAMKLSTILSLVTIAAITSIAATSDAAFSVRNPGTMCAGQASADGTFAYDGDTGLTMTRGGGLIGISASCPFQNNTSNSTSTNDGAITGISVDMYAGSGGLGANDLQVNACVWASWTYSCGSTETNAAIGANSHGSVALSGTALGDDLYYWAQDNGGGYAFVALLLNNGSITIGGTYYH